MTPPASISVVIPVLNGAGTIGNTLRSLLSQSIRAKEIIVVDNGSTDGTPAMVEQFGVQLLHEPKRGAAAARNRGLFVAGGDVVAHCDADTVLMRRWLEHLTAPFSDPQVMIAAGRIMCYPPRTPAERYLAASGVYDVEKAVVREPFPLAPSGNMAVRRSAALAIGGWDETMITAEDADFSYRVLRAFPGRIAYCPDALLLHRSRPTAHELRRQAFAYGEGVARLYHRYPEILRWNVASAARVAGRIAKRAAMPHLFAAGRIIGMTSEQTVEFARYHHLWNWWFWYGFCRRYYGARRFVSWNG